MTTTMMNCLNEAYRYARHMHSIVYAKGANYVLMRAWGDEKGLWDYLNLVNNWYGVTVTRTELASGTVYRAEGEAWAIAFNFPRVK